MSNLAQNAPDQPLHVRLTISSPLPSRSSFHPLPKSSQPRHVSSWGLFLSSFCPLDSTSAPSSFFQLIFLQFDFRCRVVSLDVLTFILPSSSEPTYQLGDAPLFVVFFSLPTLELLSSTTINPASNAVFDALTLDSSFQVNELWRNATAGSMKGRWNGNLMRGKRRHFTTGILRMLCWGVDGPKNHGIGAIGRFTTRPPRASSRDYERNALARQDISADEIRKIRTASQSPAKAS